MWQFHKIEYYRIIHCKVHKVNQYLNKFLNFRIWLWLSECSQGIWSKNISCCWKNLWNYILSHDNLTLSGLWDIVYTNWNMMKVTTNFKIHQNLLKYWLTLWHFAMDGPVWIKDLAVCLAFPWKRSKKLSRNM